MLKRQKGIHQLQTPVAPDIRRGPPIVNTTRNHRFVDIGEIMRNTPADGELLLRQSKSASSLMYPQNSYTKKHPIFGGETRTRFVFPDEDALTNHYSLNRLPRQLVWPRNHRIKSDY